MVYAQPRIFPGERDTQTPLGFWDTKGSPKDDHTSWSSIKKENLVSCGVDFTVPVDRRVKSKESKIKDQYLDLAKRLKKLWNMKVTVIPIVIGALITVTNGLAQGLEDLKMRTTRNHTNNCFIKIGQNTDKSPGDLRRLVVTQTPVKNYRLTLMWKPLKIKIKNTIKLVEIKEKIWKEYLRRSKKFLETKLCNRNFIKMKNTWTIPLVR